MKISIFIFSTLIIILIYLNQSKFILTKRYTSPNNKYILELYEETDYKPFFSLSSEHGFAEAYVVLKDTQGKLLLEPYWYDSCDFLIGDLRIEWNKNRVYFTKFNSIDLTSISFDCDG